MKRSNTIMVIILVIVMAALTIMTGCSSTSANISTSPAVSGSSTNSSTSSSSQSSAAPKKVYELKFTDQYTPIMEDAKTNETLGKLMEEHTGGQVKVTYYHAEALGKTGDFLNLLDGGIADICNIIVGWYPQNFSFYMGLEIPGIGFTDRTSKLNADWALLKGGYLKEFDKYKVLSFNVSPAMNLYMKKDSSDIASLQGAKIRASAVAVRSWIQNLGGTPVAMASPDVYMALDRGTIDGVYTGYTNYLQQKYFEVCKNVVWNPISIGSSPIIMSKSAWDRLPPDVQAGVDKAVEAYKTVYLDYYNGVDSKAVDEMKKNGAAIHIFEGDSAAKLSAAAAPLKEEWMTTMQAKSLPAKEFMDTVDQLLAGK